MAIYLRMLLLPSPYSLTGVIHLVSEDFISNVLSKNAEFCHSYVGYKPTLGIMVVFASPSLILNCGTLTGSALPMRGSQNAAFRATA